MNCLLTRTFHFNSAHSLPNYQGDCHNLHGHTWVLDVTIECVVSKETGMGIDFKTLKQIVTDKVINQLDHHLLNDIVPNPTAEALCHWIWYNLELTIAQAGYTLHSLTLYESPETSCHVTKDLLLAKNGLEDG